MKINPFQHLQSLIGQLQKGYPSVMRRNTSDDQSFSGQGLGLTAECGYINPQLVSHPLHGGTPDPPYFQKYMALGQRNVLAAARLAAGCLQKSEATYKNL